LLQNRTIVFHIFLNRNRLTEDFCPSKTQTLDEKEYEIQMKVIEAKGEARAYLDDRHNVNLKEQREEMRAALWEISTRSTTGGRR